MLGMIARRLLSLIPVLLVVTFVVFLLTELVPGDAAQSIAGGANATPEKIAEVRADLGLDRPVLTRYFDWLGDAVQLDFGKSYQSYNNVAAPDVAEEIAERIPVSLSLALTGLLVAIVIGIPLGILAGMRPGGVVDRTSVTGTSLGLAIPNFVLGFFLIQVFALSLGWFPAQGYTKFSDDPSAWLESIILPALALGVIAAASVARQTRAALIDVLQSNYVRTAFAVGTGTRRTVVKYAFKNASIPTVTVLGLQLAALIGGVVIIEQIFVIPGLGSYMLRALTLPDVPVIQAVTVTFVLIYVFLNLVVDISYGYLNPRVRTA
jgi:peptide/nickel transport system permease protein